MNKTHEFCSREMLSEHNKYLVDLLKDWFKKTEREVMSLLTIDNNTHFVKSAGDKTPRLLPFVYYTLQNRQNQFRQQFRQQA